MEENFLHKVYGFVNHIIHWDELKLLSIKNNNQTNTKKCPVTGLDISMQSKNSKFLSYIGVKWYYENDKKTFDKVLANMIQIQWLKKDLDYQFKEIAHHIRNSVSNPRNNTKRAINKIINEKNTLFDNIELIDKKKLREAGYI